MEEERDYEVEAFEALNRLIEENYRPATIQEHTHRFTTCEIFSQMNEFTGGMIGSEIVYKYMQEHNYKTELINGELTWLLKNK